MTLILIILSSLTMSMINKIDEEATITTFKTENFKITGTGRASEWDRTEWIDIPQREFGGITKSTKVKTLYSHEGIYFLYRCEDEKLTSTLREDNADLWKEDVIEVFLWTDEGIPLYFEYELSPMNYELPLLIPNLDHKFLGWIPWHYTGDRKVIGATSVDGGKKQASAPIKSWTGEFFIPFDLLKPLQNVPPTSGMKWRINMYRMDYDTGWSTWAWQPTKDTFHEYEKFGTLVFQ